MLLMHHVWLSKEDLITKIDDEIAPDLLSLLERDYSRFVDNKEPLEYILWYVEFANRRFFLDKRTLIPRPETEYMLEAVKEWISENNQQNHLLLDVWTGCWVLWISSFLVNPEKIEKLYLLDYFDGCLEVSEKNFAFHIDSQYHHKCSISQSNLLETYINSLQTDSENKWLDILLVANLPYIPDDTFDTQVEDNVKLWEPRPAFVWWEDWLDLYREMFAQIKTARTWWKMKDHITMYLEMMTWQVEILQKEFDTWISFEEVKTFHFQIRIVKAIIK